MRKLILALVFLFVPVLAYAQLPVKNTAADTAFYDNDGKTASALGNIIIGTTNLASKTYWDTHAYDILVDIINKLAQMDSIIYNPTVADSFFTVNDTLFVPNLGIKFQDGTYQDTKITSGSGDFTNNGENATVGRTLGNNDAFDLGFETNGTVRIHLESGGDIGIGTETPGEQVHLVSSTASAGIEIENTNTGASGPRLILYHNSASPAITDNTATSINFFGEDDNSDMFGFSTIYGYPASVTNGAEAGFLDVEVTVNGSSKSMIAIDGAGAGGAGFVDFTFNDDSEDVDFFFESNNFTSAWFIEGSTGDVQLNGIDPDAALHITRAGDVLIRFETTDQSREWTIGAEGTSNGQFEITDITGGNTRFVATISGEFGFNIATPSEEIHLWSSTTNEPTLLVENANSDATSGGLKILKDAGSAGNSADNDQIGYVIIVGENSLGTEKSFFELFGISTDVTNATEDGGSYITTINAGSIDTTLVMLSGLVGIGTGVFINPPDEELHLFSTSTDNPVLKIESDQDGASGGVIELFLDTDSMADDDLLGIIKGTGNDDTPAKVEYASIEFFSEDMSEPEAGGSIVMSVLLNGAKEGILRLSGYNGSVDQGEVIINGGDEDVNLTMTYLGGSTAFHVDGNGGSFNIGTVTPVTDAILNIVSTTAAVLLPRMTTGQRDALTATNGMIIYNSTTNAVNAYENGAWVDI